MTISLQISKFYTYAYKTRESHLELHSQYSIHIWYIQENTERPAAFDKKKLKRIPECMYSTVLFYKKMLLFH